MLCVWIWGSFLLLLLCETRQKAGSGTAGIAGSRGTVYNKSWFVGLRAVHSARCPFAARAENLSCWIAVEASWVKKGRQVFEHHYNLSNLPVIMLLAWYNHPAALKCPVYNSDLLSPKLEAPFSANWILRWNLKSTVLFQLTQMWCCGAGETRHVQHLSNSFLCLIFQLQTPLASQKDNLSVGWSSVILGHEEKVGFHRGFVARLSLLFVPYSH